MGGQAFGFFNDVGQLNNGALDRFMIFLSPSINDRMQ